MNDRPGFAVRDAAAEDIPAIARLYGYHVLTGLASFEDEPPGTDEMRRRFADVKERALPWLAATGAGGAVLGYAYAAPYRLRAAYRYTLEDSIYIIPEAQRRGIGRTLLAELIARTTAQGYRQMVAVIGDSANLSSIALHERLGFRHAGLLPASGFKFRRWVDSVLMQRELGDGAASLP